MVNRGELVVKSAKSVVIGRESVVNARKSVVKIKNHPTDAMDDSIIYDIS